MKKLYFALLFFVFTAAAASSQSTGFTYQGSLNNSGLPANGNYDFEFRLFNAATGGTTTAPDRQVLNVPVTNGVFTTVIDFTGFAFPGEDRFLEISVRPAGGGGFTTLTPRQKVNVTPQSIKSIFADSAANAINSQFATNASQLGGIAANQFVLTGDSRMTDSRNPLPGAPTYVQNRTTQQGSTNFNISGNGTAGGTLAGNIVTATTQFNIGTERILSIGGNANVFAGRDAGSSNSGGTGNAFFGTGAGQDNTSGTFNAFHGIAAGASNTTGNGNSFFGASAGSENVTGGNNSFFGINAGVSATGSGNSFFGALAGNDTTTGDKNAFFGFEAGRSNTIAGRNSFFGYQAGRTNTLGARNSFFGYQAGFNTSGATQDNAFFGDEAGLLNTSGNRNSFFGSGAGENNTTGDDNVFVGNNAGFANTTGGDNTFIGAGANFSPGTATGNNNTIVGSGASVVANVSFATAIGAGANANLNNMVQLGRLGDLVRVSGTFWAFADVMMADDPGERVKIGSLTGSPAQKLDVEGNIRVGGASSSVGCVEDRDGTVIAGSCSSDLRFKKNVTPFGSVLSNFSKLRPVNYFWRADEFTDKHFGTNRSYGLIAQEVEEVFPELVTTDEKGYKAVNYSKLPLLTIQAVREQQAQIERLARIVEEQKKENDDLRQDLAGLRDEVSRLSRPKP